MNPCDSLRNRFLEMLQTGVRYPYNGETKYVGYQDILKFMCTASVPRLLWLSDYKKLPPIEAFPKEEKDQWRKFVNDEFPGTTPEFRLAAIKIIYTIGVLSN